MRVRNNSFGRIICSFFFRNKCAPYNLNRLKRGMREIKSHFACDFCRVCSHARPWLLVSGIPHSGNPTTFPSGSGSNFRSFSHAIVSLPMFHNHVSTFYNRNQCHFFKMYLKKGRSYLFLCFNFFSNLDIFCLRYRYYTCASIDPRPSDKCL